jgi:hypothetical protein
MIDDKDRPVYMGVPSVDLSNEDLLAIARMARRQCGRCQHPRDLHDETGCRAEWGSYNDREFCQCMEPYFGNVVPNQGFDEDEV